MAKCTYWVNVKGILMVDVYTSVFYVTPACIKT